MRYKATSLIVAVSFTLYMFILTNRERLLKRGPICFNLTSNYVNQIFTLEMFFCALESETCLLNMFFKKLCGILEACNLQLCNFTSTVCHFQMGLVAVFSEFNLVGMVVFIELALREINHPQRIGSMLCGSHNFPVLV